MKHRRLHDLQSQHRQLPIRQVRVLSADSLLRRAQLHLCGLTQLRQQIERNLRIILFTRQRLERQQIHSLLVQLIHRRAAIL